MVQTQLEGLSGVGCWPPTAVSNAGVPGVGSPSGVDADDRDPCFGNTALHHGPICDLSSLVCNQGHEESQSRPYSAPAQTVQEAAAGFQTFLPLGFLWGLQG